MDFQFKDVSHLFSAFLVFLSFFVFLILPLISFVFPMANMDSFNQVGNFGGNFSFLFEIILLAVQLIIVILLFIIIPIVWYLLVNKFSFSQIFESIKLKNEHLDMAFLWGLITAIIALGLVIIIGTFLSVAGLADADVSNIQDLELFFSVPSILFLITIQPIAEEIFFRGFLLDKFQRSIGIYPSIIATSVLFGLAHVSMGNVIPAIIISIVALIFGYMVIKTKNLMTGIIGHVIFNLISFALYLVGKEILMEGILFYSL